MHGFTKLAGVGKWTKGMPDFFIRTRVPSVYLRDFFLFVCDSIEKISIKLGWRKSPEETKTTEQQQQRKKKNQLGDFYALRPKLVSHYIPIYISFHNGHLSQRLPTSFLKVVIGERFNCKELLVLCGSKRLSYFQLYRCTAPTTLSSTASTSTGTNSPNSHTSAILSWR